MQNKLLDCLKKNRETKAKIEEKEIEIAKREELFRIRKIINQFIYDIENHGSTKNILEDMRYDKLSKSEVCAEVKLISEDLEVVFINHYENKIFSVRVIGS
jgi:hypothetical protein